MKQHAPPFTLREMKLEVTHACPLACVHCSSDASPSCSREMTPMDCRRIVSEAAELGVKNLAFSGGEPLIWSAIDDAVSHGTELGTEVSIYTSGNVDDPKKAFRSLRVGDVSDLFSACSERLPRHMSASHESGGAFRQH